MNPIATLFATLLVVAAVHGGTHRRIARQSGPVSGSRNTDIAMQGVSLAGGEGAGVAEHASTIHVAGSADNPAHLYANTGSGVGLYQSASNYQQSNINSDGSSSAYQGNSAANSGYAYDYLGAEGQGDVIDVNSTGWSAIQGVGVVEQADALQHTADGQGWSGPSPGWKKP